MFEDFSNNPKNNPVNIVLDSNLYFIRLTKNYVHKSN